MAEDPVLFHAASAANAERRFGVPADVLLGLLSVEGGTNLDGTPRAPADGAGPPSFGQFTYSTGKSLGIKYGDSQSEVDGIARYLVQLGYKSDPRGAIAKYNGGPRNPQYGYAAKVMAAAKRYAGFRGAHNPVSQPAPTSTRDASKGGLLTNDQAGGMARFAVGAVLTLGALTGIGVGVSRAAGIGAKA